MLSEREQWRSRISFVCLLLVCSHLVLSSAIGTSWWALGVSECSLRSSNGCPDCNQLAHINLLNENQRAICQAEDETIKAISRGARKAIIDCQSQFKNRKWNCSTFYGQNLFGSFVNEGTRETAILYAYLSAGAAQGVAEACHDQKISNCPCEVINGKGSEQDEEENLIYHSCNDNIEWALNFVKRFVGNSTTTQTSTTRDLIDVHNSNLGSTIVNERTTFCVCQGISGTCTIQTCYKKVLEIGEVGSKLRVKYDGAVKVQMNTVTHSLAPINENQDPNITADLVYMGNSPDFCNPSAQSGILGTKDRLCDPDSEGTNSCSTLCCGRGYHRIRYVVPVTSCEFVWCCRIECRVVRNDTVIEHRCNDYI